MSTTKSTKTLFNKRFPAEWEIQDAILLALPHRQSDWVKNFDEVIDCYKKIIIEIIQNQILLLLVKDKSYAEKTLVKCSNENLILIECNFNDTWVRDYGALTVLEDNEINILDFTFNAWGNKYLSDLDNKVNRNIFKASIFSSKINFIPLDFVLEGGAIESNGNGTLLTTSKCLLSNERNKHLSRTQIEEYLKNYFGIKNFLWLDYGYLEGDDTDGHIDTLARFCDSNTIVYTKCYDKKDSHFHELLEMESQLKGFKNELNQPFNLVSIPLPDVCLSEEGKRLPATYVNFLIINNKVLVPIYKLSTDEEALRIIDYCFPDKEIVGIDCRPLIKQNGSLHCITMQYPVGVLKINA